MKKEIKTQILIPAPAYDVWAALTDFTDYPNWNPYITSLIGNVAVGNKIKIRLNRGAQKTIIFKPTILVVNKNKELSWRGHLLFPGLLDGEHKFKLIESVRGTTIFKHSETFSGILLPLLNNQLEQNSKEYFVAMNKKLKEKVENINKNHYRQNIA